MVGDLLLSNLDKSRYHILFCPTTALSIYFSISFSWDNSVYRTNSNPIQQQSRRQLPSLPQDHRNPNEFSSLSAIGYTDRHSLSQQEFRDMNISTSGRTSPMIILDNSSIVTDNHTR